jgi:glycosyltransferase involved in cell wall biosynthesis
MRSVLYITYDGLLEPLGQSQVLAYLAQLAADHRVHILSFEKQADRRNREGVAAMRGRLQALGIGWTPLPYHKTPTAPATAFDVAVGAVVALWLALRLRARIVHVRSYVPALMALPVRRLTRAKLLFDMRGFWADERVDGALWPRGGTLYRLAKSLETRFIDSADHIVTLTSASARELRGFEVLRSRPKPISVIPTCADLLKFHPAGPRAAQPFVFGYVGSVGTWYLFEETLAFFRQLLARRPDARFLVVNRKEHAQIREMAAAQGIPADRIELVSATHDEVPALIQRMHLGAALIKPSYSKIASAPTKMAEYLGCGVPCLGNVRVGDVAEVLRERRVGVVLEDFGAAGLAVAVEEALRLVEDPALAARCEATARELFSLEHGVAAYREIYQSLQPQA